jgi:hypothetical protein
MKEIRAQIEALANQTDEDRDGDIDFAARAERDSTSRPNAEFKETVGGTPSVVSPEKLALSLSPSADLVGAIPDLVKSISLIIDQKVEERVAGLREELSSRTEVGEVAGVTADVAKFASGIAKGLADLAVGSEAIAKRVADGQEESRKLSEELARIKRIAQPVKGQTAQIIEKTIGADAYSSVPADITKSVSQSEALEALANKARDMKDEGSRKALAEEVYKMFSAAQRR